MKIAVDHRFLTIFSILLAAHLLIMAWMRMYPFVDLSFHLAAATIYRHINDPGNLFKEFYTVDSFLKPNTFHLWFCSLPFFKDVETGNKLFYLLYTLLLPSSVFLIVKELKGNPWVVLLSTMLLYNYNTTFGFVGYTFAIPVVLLIFYFFLKTHNSHRPVYLFIIAALLLSLFFMHALSTLFALATLCTAIVVAHFKNPKKILLSLLVVIPVLAINFYWWTTTQQNSNTLSFLINYYSTEYLPTFYLRVNFLYLDNFGLFKGLKGNIVALILSLFIYLPLFISLVYTRNFWKGTLYSKPLQFAWIFFVVATSCHFILPSWLPPDEVIIYERFSVYVALASIILLSVYLPEKFRKPVMVTSALASFIHLFLWGEAFFEFEKNNKYFTEDLFPDRYKNLKLSGFISHYHFRRVQSFIMYPDYFITWKKGIGATSAIDYRFGAVRRKVSTEVLPKFDHWMVRKNNYKGEYEALELILVNGSLPSSFAPYIQKYSVVNSSGNWKLLKRNDVNVAILNK